MPAPTISALTPAPNRLDPNFATVADAFLNGFPTLRAEINAFANYLNTTALVSYAFSDGTAAQPTMRFASDGDTGVFRPASNTLGFSAGGSERMRIDGSGKVAMGTSAPVNGATLTIQSADTRSLYVKRTDASPSNETYALEVDNDAQTSNVTASGALRVRSGAKNALTVNGLGNVGVGTFRPDAQMHVTDNSSGVTSIVENSANNARLLIHATGTNKNSELWFGDLASLSRGRIDYDHADDSLSFWTTDTEKVRIASNGYVGIGTAAPYARLDLGFATATNQRQAILARPSGGDNAFSLYAGTGGGYNPYEDYFKIGIMHNSTQNASVNFHRGGSATGGFLSFATNEGSEKMRLDESGRLAVGTTNNLEAKITARSDGAGVQELLNLANWKSTSGEVGTAIRLGYGNLDSGYGTRIVNYGDPAVTRSGSLVFERGVASGADYRETMRVHHNGRVGINQPNPTSILDIAESLGPEISLTRTGSADGNGIIRSVGNTGVVNTEIRLGNGSSDNITFATNGSEKMRLSDSGSLSLGTTTDNPILHRHKGMTYHGSEGMLRVRGNAEALQLATMASSGVLAKFYSDTGSAITTAGNISISGSSVSFNTSSDYRLKEDLQDILTPAEHLMQLKPVNVSWRADGTRSDTFIAHELAEVLPYAVTGEKDATGPDGNPEYQSVDYSKVVPLLTAALQEAVKKIENLETRINAMEGQA